MQNKTIRNDQILASKKLRLIEYIKAVIPNIIEHEVRAQWRAIEDKE